jgi:hypothetical protein
VVLRNFSGRNADSFRVFAMEALYKRRGDVRGQPGPHTWWWCGQGAPAPPYGVPAPWPPSGSPSNFVLCQGKIEGSGFASSNSKNISCVTFLKHKNSRKQGTGTVASR